MEIKTLENYSLKEIAEVFNRSFSDYIIKLQLSEQQLADKITSENIKLNLSFGAFDNDQLVGFILHGTDIFNNSLVAYNAGTGVIPEFRGKGVTDLMYKIAFEVLGKKEIHNHQLEVITTNIKAIKIYKRQGFTVSREFNCYKGKMTGNLESKYQIEVTESLDLDYISEFWESEPSWQNSNQSINRLREKFIFLSVKAEDTVIGYSIFSQHTGRIQQIAVKKAFRNQGIGRSLIYKMGLMIDTPELVLINIDARNITLNAFLKSIGFVNFINLSEMKLKLSNN